MPPATREAPAAEYGAGTVEVRKATPPTPSVALGRDDSAAVAAAAATTAAPAVTAATATTAGTFLRLWGDLRGTWRFSASSPHPKPDA